MKKEEKTNVVCCGTCKRFMPIGMAIGYCTRFREEFLRSNSDHHGKCYEEPNIIRKQRNATLTKEDIGKYELLTKEIAERAQYILSSIHTKDKYIQDKLTERGAFSRFTIKGDKITLIYECTSSEPGNIHEFAYEMPVSFLYDDKWFEQIGNFILDQRYRR